MTGAMKGKLLKIVNPIFFLIMLTQLISGLGQGYGSQQVFLVFRRIHFFNSRLLMVVFVIHLYLNWAWIKGWIKTSLLRSPSRKW